MDAPPQEYQNKKLVRFRGLKWIEAQCAADETWFIIPTHKRDTEIPPALEAARKKAATEHRNIETRIELLEKGGPIEPKGLPWAVVNPDGKVGYTIPTNGFKEPDTRPNAPARVLIPL